MLKKELHHLTHVAWIIYYASLQTFLNFLIMEKQQKRNKINNKITSSTISKSFIKKSKRKSPRFWIRTGQISSWWDNFCAGQKFSKEWKENFCMPKKSYEKLCTKLRPYIQKNEWSQRYIALQMKVSSKCNKLFWYREIDNFENYQACFVFTFIFALVSI